MSTHPSSPRRRSQGMTLVEMMVAITIGMFIVAAMAILFANNSKARTETDRAAQKIENGRYAMDLLSTDLAHAGYYYVFDPNNLTSPTTMPDPCTYSLASVKAAMRMHIQGYDNTASGLTCLSNVKSGTDVVVVRRVGGTCVTGITGVATSEGCSGTLGSYYGFQASSCAPSSSTTELSSGTLDDNWYKVSATTGDFTLHKKPPTASSSTCSAATTAPVFPLVYRIYYIASCDVCTGSNADTIPTLKRVEILTTGVSTPMSLVQGIENMQIEYGIDENADGNPDVYTASPKVYYTCTDPSAEVACSKWTSVVSAKVALLVRSTESSGDPVTGKTYYLGNQAYASGTTSIPQNTVAATDNYKRTVFTQVIRLENPSGRSF